MKLRHKITFILGTVIIAFTTALYFIQIEHILPAYNKVEEIEVQKDLALCTNALENEIDHLQLLAKYWATWDDTCDFITEKNRINYIKSNLSAFILKEAKLDILLFYDTCQKLIWGKIMNIKSAEYKAISEMTDFLNQNNFLFTAKNQINKRHYGIMLSPLGVSILTINPIIHSNNKGPCVGTIVIGRYCNLNYLSKIIDQTKVLFRIYSLNDTNIQHQIAPSIIKALSNKKFNYSISPNKANIFCFETFNNIKNQPTFLISSEIPRSIYKKASDTLNFTLFAVIAVGILLLIIMTEFMHYIVIKPISKLTEYTNNIKQSHYKLPLQTYKPKRKDEIGILSKEFTSMAQETQEFIEKMENTIDKRNQDIRSAREDTILRLAIAVESKDNDTGKHIFRIQLITKFIADKLENLTKKTCDNISLASTLHDIGKIGVPDSILKKEGKLEVSEYETMKQHTNIGAKILTGSNSQLLETAREIALYHHERWDGKGYPTGLKGKNIPLSARITNIADIYDALRSPRPYKDAWPLKEVLEYLNSNRGTIFDPNLAQIVIDSIEEIEKIREYHQD